MAEESKDRSSHAVVVGRRIARERWKIVCLVVLALLSGGGWLVVKHWAVNEEVSVNVAADQGVTSITLDADTTNAVSPGCGCEDPAMGGLLWHGMEIPSQGFDLGVHPKRTERDRLSGWWALTAMLPDVDVTDWFAVPLEPIQMKITVAQGNHQLTVFRRWVNFTDLLLKGHINVTHGARYPYAALLPAAGGRTKFDASAGAYDGSGGRLDISTTAPPRGDPDHKLFGRSGAEYKGDDTSIEQRGPMIDVLGPTITMDVPHGRNLIAYAGAYRLPPFPRSAEVEITLKTPYSIRLFPFPATSTWKNGLPYAWSDNQRHAREDKDFAAGVKRGPFLQGRFLSTEPLPSYDVHMSDVVVPEARTWKRFATGSAEKQSIGAMIKEPNLGQTFVVAEYRLPPVTTRSQIGVFGRITELDTSSMSGDVLVRSDDTPLGQGQSLKVRSIKGLTAGDYRLSPLVSSGDPTTTSHLHGTAKVWVAGESLTPISGGTWAIATLIGSVVALMMGVVLDALTDARREDE